MSYRNPPVVIIGAGVGGLTLALLLRQRGIAAEVLEQSAELHEAGAAVGLAANATRVLRHLGLGEDLARVSAEPDRLIHRDGRDGRQVATSEDSRWYRERFGAPFYGLHRMALQRLLAGAFGPEHLHLGCRAEALEETRAGMRVRCASGAVFEAAVVVGADGVHSVVRDWVTGGDEPVYSGTSGFRGLVPAERLPSLPDPGALQFWMGPGAHLLHYPIDGGRVVNFLAVIDGPLRWTAPAWLEEAAPGAHLAPFAGWHPAVTEMLGRRAAVTALGPVLPAPAGLLEPRSRGPARRRGSRDAAAPGAGGQPDDRGRRRAGRRTRRGRRRARRAAPLRRPAPGPDPAGPADVLGRVRRAAPARRPGRAAPGRGPGPPDRRPGLDPRLRRARPRYWSRCAMLGGGGIAEPASAVLGGGGTAEQEGSTVAGGGGIAEHEGNAVCGGGGTAEQASPMAGGGGIAEQDGSAVLGGGGIAEQDGSAVLGGGGMTEPDSDVRGGGGIAEQDSAVLGGGGIIDPERSGLSAIARTYCPASAIASPSSSPASDHAPDSMLP